MSEQNPERPQRKPGRTSGGGGGMRFGRGVFGWGLLIVLLIMLMVLVNQNRRPAFEVPFNTFREALEAGKIANLTLEDDRISGELTQPEQLLPAIPDKIRYFRTPLPMHVSSDFRLMEWVDSRLQKLTETGKKAPVFNIESNPSLIVNVLVPFIPWLLIFAFVWFFVFKQLRNSAGSGGMLGSFGRSKHKITTKEHTNVTFEDVAGIEEAKEEVSEIVEFLKNPKKFQRLGGRIPRGVLLVGEPGTGKTLLAKAIAGEADVPFFSISGSDFVEMFVGVGASRVRDLFKQAKDNSPCIIFLDEIDAVGRRRGSGFSSGGHDEREQTLNAILVEMDGFDTNDQVIVCAATNRVDVLDPALTRPGRFDRQIYVPLPDVKGRFDIIRVHSRKVKLGPNVDLMKLARATPGFSGADLAAIINESALGATLAGKEFIEQDDLEEARDKVRWGRARKSRAIDEKEKLATAYHEAGHAVVQALEKDGDPIHKVTIIPRGQAGGATMSLPEKDRMSTSKKWCMSFLRTVVAGRIAEELFTGDVNTGAYGDIRQATGLARKMIRDWGMNDRIGFVYYGDDDRGGAFFDFGPAREYSEEVARMIDEEVKKLIDSVLDETRKIIEANRDRIEAIARALLKYETLDGPDIDRMMRGDVLTKPTVGDLLEKEQRRNSTVSQPNDPPALPGLGGGPLPAPG